jgi:hypothetical protein
VLPSNKVSLQVLLLEVSVGVSIRSGYHTQLPEISGT